MFGKVTLLAADSEHPNKRPFKGVLTYLNAYSDKAPGGSKGRKVYIPADVGEEALPSLVGMAVNVRSDLSGHDPSQKVGVIEKAYLAEALDDGRVPVMIEGYLYAYDYADLVDELVASQDELGFSYETTQTTAIADGGTLMVTSLVFTGAAILYKNKAAYQTTSFAAESEDDMNEEQLKEMLAAMGLDMASLLTTLAAWDEFKKQFDGDGKYASLSVYLSAQADAEAKVNELTEKVAALEASLTEAQTKLNASADENPNLEGYVKVEEYNALKASLDEMTAKVEALAPLAEKVEALSAEADEKAKHERKSVAGVQLLAKYQPIGEVTDLKAEIGRINADATLTAVEKVAKIMEAQAKFKAQ